MKVFLQCSSKFAKALLAGIARKTSGHNQFLLTFIFGFLLLAAENQTAGWLTRIDVCRDISKFVIADIHSGVYFFSLSFSGC